MGQSNICWTCRNVMTINCPKNNHSESKVKMHNAKVYECDEYDYDGECLSCPLNVEHIKGAIYDTCTHFIKGCQGYCSQENWKRGNYKLHGEE